MFARTLIIVAMLLVVYSQPSHAARWTFQCVFDKGAAAVMDGRTIKQETNIRYGEYGKWTYTNVDVDKGNGKALMIGKDITQETSYMITGSNITFVEISKTGNVAITTFYVDANTPNYRAVTSRHNMDNGPLTPGLPQQYYGTCTAVRAY